MDSGTQPSRRSIVFVAGSGRSGTSVFSGLLQRLGYHVPQPEVEPDASNPKGFGESRWVVDLHVRLLRQAGVQTADARPTAWSEAMAVSTDAVAGELHEFLAETFATHEHVVIKDPRLIWFLPLWRRVAEDLGVTPRFVTMLRHPAAVIASKSRHYAEWSHLAGDVSRTAGWVNTMLHTERATRDGLRAFVRYDDLLEDWPKALAAAAERLSLEPVATATATRIREAEAFVDPSLARSQPTWAGFEIPPRLEQQAEHVWTLLDRLAEPDCADLTPALEAARHDYLDLYREAEAIAAASIVAAGRKRAKPAAPAAPAPSAARRLGRRLPGPVRRAVRAALGGRPATRA